MTPLAARLAAPATMAALLLFLLLLAAPASATNFTCATVGKTCQSAIGYAVPNATTYGELAARFNTTTTLAELLGANGLPTSTPASTALAAKATVRVPFRCRCGSNGVGQSDGGPFYVVYPQDGLDHIAREVFGAFVTYQEIAAANSIPDPNQILVGQKLRIPLPCTCDQVDGADVMHFAYSVAKGDDTPGIAARFGVTESTLLSLNKITDPKTLQQGQILDVPLPEEEEEEEEEERRLHDWEAQGWDELFRFHKFHIGLLNASIKCMVLIIEYCLDNWIQQWFPWVENLLSFFFPRKKRFVDDLVSWTRLLHMHASVVQRGQDLRPPL